MFSLLCNIWVDFRNWVTNDWTQTTFLIVMCILGVLGLLSFLAFFKQSFDKGKTPKWWKLIVALLLFGVIALLSWARYA